MTTARRKFALLGFARTYTDAPFTDASVEIWGMNELYKLIPRWDRWFELHDTGYLGKTARAETPDEPTRHLEWLRAQTAERPIYMLRKFEDIAAGVPYPLDAMVDHFGRYFTSTVGYMLALAISEILDARAVKTVPEPDEWIGLFGIDLGSAVEYMQQRPNAEYLVGMARGLGIPVFIPDTAAICHAPSLYGFEPPPNEAGLVNEHFYTVQLQRAQAKHYEAEANMRTRDGVLQTLAALNEKRVELKLSTEALTFIRGLIIATEEQRSQDNANWNKLSGVMESFQLCLQAMEFRRRGIYIPECDPFAVKGTSA